MDVVGVIQSFFCKSYMNRVTALESEKTELQEQLSECGESLCFCLDDKEILKIENKDLKEDADYFEERCNTLSEMLAKSITIPDIQSHINLDEAIKIDPYDEPSYFPYDTKAADEEYYTFPKETWIAILGEIQPIVKQTLVRFKSEVGDCDDFALVMNAFTAIAFRKTSLTHQGAFMVMWSRSHAYNAYLDTDKQTWLYEPQDGATIGRLEAGVDNYETRLIWFPGKQVD